MIFGGDVMLGRFVREQVDKRGKHDARWLTQNIAVDFRKADLAFVNLESPFAPGPPLNADMIFRANPSHVTALTNLGVDVVSFANNHSRNQGNLGITTTLNTLGMNGITAAGAGFTASSAYSARYVKAGDQLVAVLAYAYNEKAPNGNPAVPTIAGMDIDRMQEAVRAAKKITNFVIVSMHAGTEYTQTLTTQQKNFAHAAIDAGANLVVGAHPHWVQPVEVYKHVPIVYSLGNLVFDQSFSVFTEQGAVAVVTVRNGKVAQVQLKLVKIDNAAQPRWMTATEAAPVLKRIGLPSGILKVQ